MFAILGMIAIFFGLGTHSTSANAAETLSMKPSETGNVYYDTGNIYTMYGTKHGAAWSDSTAAMAVSPNDGSAQKLVFCIEPGVPFLSSNNPNYEAVGVNGIPVDAQIASVVWDTDYAFGANWSNADRITAQAVIWELLPQYGIKVDSISGIPDFQAKKQKLYDGIKEYKRSPEFNEQTVSLTFGETKTLTSSVNLNSYDKQISNSAKVNWNIAADGRSVDVTPTDPNVQSGTIAFKRSYMEGTPIALEKQGSQTVYLPSVKDPASYTVKFDIKTVGNVDIMKLDQETGKALPGFTFEVTFPDRKDLPKQTVTTGSDGKSSVKNVPHGVCVIAKEIAAPAPYVLASALNQSDEVEGVIEAGKTITLTKKNKQAKGQIIVEKSGVESDHNMWNNNYTLAGNVFEIRKDTDKGEVVRTITTDDKGYAETDRELPLGTYVVTEKTASNGFANTFKPVTVKIEYKDQKQAVIVVGSKGTNQEVVGSTLLTKEDAETGSEAQGRATFDGATYGLFHKDGTSVKWTDKVKPELTNGTKIETEDDSIVIRIDDEDQTAGVKHLALGKYYWLETKAPEGYQLDSTKHEFELKYKDQDTKVVAANVTSKEKVIKFSIDGFKYLQSKSGDVASGYNGIKFSLTPIDPTKGEVQEVETKTDDQGYDGYWKFGEFPYGDYRMSEVEAPEGYKKMKDLILKSTFDAKKREYNVTVTEEGQKEPIKTLTVEESKINEGSNHISLGKLMITNHLVKAPQISTKASVDGKQTFVPGKDTPMKDTINLSDLNKDGKYRLKAIKLWRIQNDDKENAEVVYEADEDFVADAENMEKVVETLVDTSKDDENTRYVWTEKLAELDEEGNEKEVAEHEDLDNKEQTVTPEISEEKEPKIETLFVTADGDQEIDATKDQKLIDKVKQEFPESQVGLDKFWVHKLHKVTETTKETTDSSKTTTTSSTTTSSSSTATSDSKTTADSSTTKEVKSEVLETINDTRKVNEGNEEFDVDFEYYAKKYNLKEGEKLVVTHEVFNDEKHEDKYADHFDLNNEKQTIRPKKVETEKEKAATPAASTPEKSIPQTGSYNAFQEFFSTIFN